VVRLLGYQPSEEIPMSSMTVIAPAVVTGVVTEVGVKSAKKAAYIVVSAGGLTYMFVGETGHQLGQKVDVQFVGSQPRLVLSA
jgi:hypothetical protein